MSTFLSKMFDVGDLPVLTFGNWVLKAEWLSGLWNYMYVFLRFFFKIEKNMTFYVFLSSCTRFPEQWQRPMVIMDRKKSFHRSRSIHDTFDDLEWPLKAGPRIPIISGGFPFVCSFTSVDQYPCALVGIGFRDRPSSPTQGAGLQGSHIFGTINHEITETR